ncbi:hypothetical protein ABPG75_002383 [Micractinium tetrahymenae]
MNSASLSRAAQRLGGAGIRGLSDALKDAGTASSSGRQPQQPWMVTAVRALGGGGSGGGGSDAPGSSSNGSSAPAGPVPRLDEVASSSGRSAATAAAEAAAAAATSAARPRPPPGHTDFQQRQLLMLFTCSRCNTRAAKAFSKQSYEQGVVIVECPGCHNKHLIADNLGWFGQKGTVEEFAADRGGTVVRKMADGTVELTPEDLLGASLVEEAAAAQQAQAAAATAAAAAPGGSSGASSGERD